MKANRKTESTVTITLTMPLSKFDEIVEGLGKTSTTSREQAGMSYRQAGLVGELYFALRDAEIA